jgi:hypothetical protein
VTDEEVAAVYEANVKRVEAHFVGKKRRADTEGRIRNLAAAQTKKDVGADAWSSWRNSGG